MSETVGQSENTTGANKKRVGLSMEQPIEELGLSTRSTRGLLRNNIKTLEDLLPLSAKEIKELPSLGNACVDEIMSTIHKYFRLANCFYDDEITEDSLICELTSPDIIDFVSLTAHHSLTMLTSRISVLTSTRKPVLNFGQKNLLVLEDFSFPTNSIGILAVKQCPKLILNPLLIIMSFQFTVMKNIKKY